MLHTDRRSSFTSRFRRIVNAHIVNHSFKGWCDDKHNLRYFLSVVATRMRNNSKPLAAKQAVATPITSPFDISPMGKQQRRRNLESKMSLIRARIDANIKRVRKLGVERDAPAAVQGLAAAGLVYGICATNRVMSSLNDAMADAGAPSVSKPILLEISLSIVRTCCIILL